ncbi:MAG: penicillin-binding protein activator [Agarilytica sp.]
MKAKRYLIATYLLTLSLTILQGCGSTAVKSDKAYDTESEITISLEEITERLDYADQQDLAIRSRIYLDITQALLNADEIDWARNTLEQLSPLNVPDTHFIRFAVVSAALAHAQGRPFRAKAFLWDERLESVFDTSAQEDVIKLYEMRARLLFALAEFRASIEVRLAMHDLLNQNIEASEENQNALWLTLMELPLDDLKLESQLQSSMLARGWYTLATLSKNNQTNLKQQIAEVENWMFRWPEHPASMQLPADLQLLKQLHQDRPHNIAIMLPFSGRFSAAANAIRDGIMAAYYEASLHEDSLPDLRIYDTSEKNIHEVFDNAVLNGAQLIIGPLEQNKIIELSKRPELPVPVLALNRIETEHETPFGLFQFGLSLEDEVQQIAERAWNDGKRRAMILAPATNNGDRAVNTFYESWLNLGGEITDDYRYKDQAAYSNLIKNALKIQESEKRRRDLRYLIGSNIEFEPRRRKDIDVIFFYGHGNVARQLKPILAFHYAGDIPVYAARNVYNGSVNTKRDRDLNDIRFTTLPWFFDNTTPEKRAILNNIPSSNYQFLYALGVDAFHIHPRLRQLLEVKQAKYYGTTGTLQLDDKQRIRREQVWAKFKNGRALPMTTFTNEDDLQNK